MLWFGLALLIVLVALAALAVLVLGLWRRVKALSHVLTAAGGTLASATDALEAAQSTGAAGAAAPPRVQPPVA